MVWQPVPTQKSIGLLVSWTWYASDESLFHAGSEGRIVMGTVECAAVTSNSIRADPPTASRGVHGAFSQQHTFNVEKKLSFFHRITHF